MSHVDDGTLHAHLDGELSPVERERLEAHLAECGTCRQRLDEERALIERASGVLGLARPAERPAPPLQRLRRSPSPAGWRIRRPLAWAATVVLALGLGYYMGAMDSAPGAALPEGRLAILTDSVREATPSAAPSAPPATQRRRAESGRRPAAPAAERQDTVRNVLAAKTESITTAPAVVTVDGAGVQLRQAAPEPVAGTPVVTARMATEEAERQRLVATEWPIIRREPARQLLGADPLGVPGATVKDIRRSPAGDAVVVVEQVLDSGTVIQLFQRRAETDGRAMGYAAPQAAARETMGTRSERLARFVGSLRVEIAGPLSPDSLSKLLERLRPIP